MHGLQNLLRIMVILQVNLHEQYMQLLLFIVRMCAAHLSVYVTVLANFIALLYEHLKKINCALYFL